MAERLEQLLKLYEADPSDPFLTYGIALEHAKAGRHDEAVVWLDKTLALDGQYCYAYYQKARMYSETGRDEQARQAVEAGMAAAKLAGDEHAHSELAELLASIEA